MRMKTQAGSLMMSMAASMGAYEFNEMTMVDRLTKEEIEEKKAIALKERNKKQGINEYFYGQNVIYARNKKNADRKARNKSYL